MDEMTDVGVQALVESWAQRRQPEWDRMEREAIGIARRYLREGVPELEGLSPWEAEIAAAVERGQRQAAELFGQPLAEG